MSPSVTKDKVHYREGTATKRCGLCSMYRRPGRCTLVKGGIAPGDVCDRFVKK